MYDILTVFKGIVKLTATLEGILGQIQRRIQASMIELFTKIVND